ncbi:late histone H2B.L4-like [Mangifera indica]|uniref:late histone H2B.L4-like n=1 Tax=Mangifera indica TaxID=29780 RepID=UPI001CFBA26D|nr:late histone H2B.L4-like [Mangifera indica]
MPPKRSAKVVVTKKVVQETVQVSILEAKKKAKDPGEDNEQPQLKSISIEDKGGGGEKSETKKEEKDQLGNEKSKGKKRKRRSGGGSEKYKTYVFKVLKQVHPGMAISSKATTVVNNYMADMFERIADEAATLSKYNKRMTLSSREILGAVKVVLPGDLGKHAIAEGNKAVTNYLSHNVNDSKS